jgi:hypothetical protein
MDNTQALEAIENGVTEIKKAMQELQHMQDELNSLALYIISHKDNDFSDYVISRKKEGLQLVEINCELREGLS